ncbi:Protein anthesis pomoting factor 1 [Vitis vinifera]|uniref:Protein anthesis pomoting factor 1 n=1 Tax=Vitis vinifera TaxID=29760 RepID=A0A438JIC9_VITVI|nr:Protein anthesis pomoting factor 1 [Vitis vinifera]
MMSLTELDDETVRSMSIGALFSDFVGKINSLDFHRTDDLLVTASEDDSVRLYDIANAKLLKTTYHKKHGADRICFTHHPSSVICSSRHNLDSTGGENPYDIYLCTIIGAFATSKGIKRGSDLSLVLHTGKPREQCYQNLTTPAGRLVNSIFPSQVVSLCMSPINDSFMSGSLDHSVRIWDLRVNSCQGILRLRGRPTVAYDQQGLVFAVAMEGGAIKLFDSRSYDKGPFDTFFVGGDTAEVCDIKFSNDGKSMLLTTTNNNIYVLDAYGGEKDIIDNVVKSNISPGAALWVQFGTISKYNHRGNFYPGWPICGFRYLSLTPFILEDTQGGNGGSIKKEVNWELGLGSGDGTLHAWSISMRHEALQPCWSFNWAMKTMPKRLPGMGGMLEQQHRSYVLPEVGSSPSHVRAASTVLTFWIPNASKSTADPVTQILKLDLNPNIFLNENPSYISSH